MEDRYEFLNWKDSDVTTKIFEISPKDVDVFFWQKLPLFCIIFCCNVNILLFVNQNVNNFNLNT